MCAGWCSVEMPCLIAVPSARRSCKRMEITSREWLEAMNRLFLSSKIVQAHGDYLWTVKENEKGFYQDSEVLFQPHRKRAGTSAPPNDFRGAREQWRKDTGASKSARSP